MGRLFDKFKAGGGVPLTTAYADGGRGPTPAAIRPVGARHRSYGCGWDHITLLGHMCRPPYAYSKGYGSGSTWSCFECFAVWEADGIRKVSEEYRESAHGGEMTYGPKRWLFQEGPNATPSGEICANIQDQQDIYDWREADEVIAGYIEEFLPVLRLMAQQPVVNLSEDLNYE